MPKNPRQIELRIVNSELSVGNTTERKSIFVEGRLGGGQNLLFFI